MIVMMSADECVPVLKDHNKSSQSAFCILYGDDFSACSAPLRALREKN
jgi:hypothetical protein